MWEETLGRAGQQLLEANRYVQWSGRQGSASQPLSIQMVRRIVRGVRCVCAQVDAHLFRAYKGWKYLKSSAYCNGKPRCCVNQRRDILLEDDGSGKTS